VTLGSFFKKKHGMVLSGPVAFFSCIRINILYKEREIARIVAHRVKMQSDKQTDQQTDQQTDEETKEETVEETVKISLKFKRFEPPLANVSIAGQSEISAVAARAYMDVAITGCKEAKRVVANDLAWKPVTFQVPRSQMIEVPAVEQNAAGDKNKTNTPSQKLAFKNDVRLKITAMRYGVSVCGIGCQTFSGQASVRLCDLYCDVSACAEANDATDDATDGGNAPKPKCTKPTERFASIPLKYSNCKDHTAVVSVILDSFDKQDDFFFELPATPKPTQANSETEQTKANKPDEANSKADSKAKEEEADDEEADDEADEQGQFVEAVYNTAMQLSNQYPYPVIQDLFKAVVNVPCGASDNVPYCVAGVVNSIKPATTDLTTLETILEECVRATIGCGDKDVTETELKALLDRCSRDHHHDHGHGHGHTETKPDSAADETPSKEDQSEAQAQKATEGANGGDATNKGDGANDKNCYTKRKKKCKDGDDDVDNNGDDDPNAIVYEDHVTLATALSAFAAFTTPYRADGFSVARPTGCMHTDSESWRAEPPRSLSQADDCDGSATTAVSLLNFIGNSDDVDTTYRTLYAFKCTLFRYYLPSICVLGANAPHVANGVKSMLPCGHAIGMLIPYHMVLEGLQQGAKISENAFKGNLPSVSAIRKDIIVNSQGKYALNDALKPLTIEGTSWASARVYEPNPNDQLMISNQATKDAKVTDMLGPSILTQLKTMCCSPSCENGNPAAADAAIDRHAFYLHFIEIHADPSHPFQTDERLQAQEACCSAFRIVSNNPMLVQVVQAGDGQGCAQTDNKCGTHGMKYVAGVTTKELFHGSFGLMPIFEIGALHSDLLKTQIAKFHTHVLPPVSNVTLTTKSNFETDNFEKINKALETLNPVKNNDEQTEQEEQEKETEPNHGTRRRNV
jgi:hypothetical protein